MLEKFDFAKSKQIARWQTFWLFSLIKVTCNVLHSNQKVIRIQEEPQRDLFSKFCEFWTEKVERKMTGGDDKRNFVKAKQSFEEYCEMVEENV